jgi:hypothetical protein
VQNLMSPESWHGFGPPKILSDLGARDVVEIASRDLVEEVVG